MKGSGGKDYFYGGDGDDDLRGGAGIGRLYGENGNDLVRGGAGDDILVGGDGRDLLSGGDIGIAKATDGIETAKFEGNSAITISVGGTALDSTYASEVDFASAYFVQSSVAGDQDTLISIEKLLGSSVNDTLKLNALSAAILANPSFRQGGLLEVNLADEIAASGRGGDVLDMSNLSEKVSLISNASSSKVTAKADSSRGVTVLGVEHVIGTGFSDTLSFGAAVRRGVIIEGGAGEDNITGGSGSDLIMGGAGADVLNGGAGSDKIVSDGDVGDKSIDGGADNDIIVLKTSSATIKFAKGGGSDVVQFDLSSGNYALDLVGLNAADIEVIGGGFDAYYALGDPDKPDGTWYQFLTIKVKGTGDQITFLENGLNGVTNIGPSSNGPPIGYNKGNYYPEYDNVDRPTDEGQLDRITFANGTSWTQKQIWDHMTRIDDWAYRQGNSTHGFGSGVHDETDFVPYVNQTYLQAFTDFVT